MRSIRLILLSSMFILLLSIPIYALAYGNFDAELATIKLTDSTIKYDPYCFGTCYIPLRIKPALTSISIQSKDITSYTIKNQGIDSKNILMKYKQVVNESYQEEVIDYHYDQDCYSGGLPQTCQKIIDGYHFITRYRLALKDFSDFTMNSGTWSNIVLEIYIPPSTSSYAVDVVPSIKGINLTAFAWFNSTFNYCKNITVTENSGGSFTNPNYPIEMINVNTSSHVSGDAIRIVNASCSNGGYSQNFGLRKNATDNYTIAIQVPLTASTNTTWSMYYGNTSTVEFTNTTYEQNANNWFGGSEDGTLGANDVNWLLKSGTGTWKVDGANVYNGTKSMFGNVPTGTLYLRANTSSSSPLPKITNYTLVELAIRHNGTADTYYSIGDVDTGKRCGIILTVNTGNKFKYWVGTTATDTGKVWVANNWYILQFMIDPAANTYNASLLYGANRSSFWSANNIACFDASYGNDVSEIWVDLQGTSTASVDNVLTKRWLPSALIPTYSIGAEATSGTPIIWANNTSSIVTTYSYTANSNFSVDWSDKDANGYNTSLFYTNCSNGTYLSYATTRASNTSYINITLPACSNAGYYWYANDSSGTSNTTPTWYYTINKATNPLWFCIQNRTSTYCASTFTGSPSVLTIGYTIYETYPNPLKFTYGSSLSDAPTSTGMWGASAVTLNASLVNNTDFIFPASVWDSRYNTTANQNYSANYSGNGFIINQGTPTISITFNTSSTVIQGTPVNISCSVNSPLTAYLYNDSGTTSNPLYLNTSSLLGIYNYTCNTTGNANYTAYSIDSSLIVTSGSGLSVYVYDEESSLPLTFNITVNNGTISNTAYNQGNPYTNSSITGLLTIDISSTGYQQRTYYMITVASNASNLTGYLLPTADGTWVIFNVQTAGTEQPIQNALINVERLIPPASWLTVAQKKTDASGVASIFLSPITTYRFNVSATGYSNQSSQLQPAASPYYFYIMSASALNISYNTPYKNLIILIEPDGTALYKDTNNAFKYYILSSDNMLEFEGWKLTYSNGTVILLQNTTNAGGVTYTTNINTAIYNTGYIDMNYWFKKNGFNLVNATRRYYIYPVHYYNTSIMAEVADIAAGVAAGTPDVTMEQFAFISMLISIVCMAAASSQMKMFGSGVTGLMVLSMLTFIGQYIWGSAYLIGWSLVALLGLGIIAAMAIRGGFG